MKRVFVIILTLLLVASSGNAQRIVKTVDLFNVGQDDPYRGDLFIFHDPAIDTLISRHLEANRLAGGIDGYRIQVYRRGHRAARDEADKVMAQVISDYPDMRAYQEFERPNFYIVRLGDFRTRIDAMRALEKVRRSFSESYLVRQKINLPEIINQ
ncbi:MAG: SPOR domain-containing protein [Bacteroidales bacterium]